VVEASRQWTWRDWNSLADRLADGLERLGVRSGQVIAVRSRTRFEWCIVDAAAAKLGCVLLCLNWRLTSSEVAYILADSQASVMICDDDAPGCLAKAWDARDAMVAISIDRAAPGFISFEALLEATAPPRFSEAEARLMIYTSGTTGAPKGVVSGTAATSVIVRREYLADVMAQGNQQPGDVVLVSVPLHHGLGSGLVRRAVEFGNRLVLLRKYEPEAALAAIQIHRVTFWFAPCSSVWRHCHPRPSHVMTARRSAPS
jgi:long-chain acyl-CoA synthetase